MQANNPKQHDLAESWYSRFGLACARSEHMHPSIATGCRVPAYHDGLFYRCHWTGQPIERRIGDLEQTAGQADVFTSEAGNLLHI